MKKTFQKVLLSILGATVLLCLFTVGTFAAAKKLPFSDVKTSRWSYPYVAKLYNAGVVNGVTATKFKPEDNVTRAEFVKMLGCIEGIDPKAFTGSDFADVSKKAWYAPYVKWAVKTGVTKGVSATRFEPDGQITRQDMATMIYRYIQSRGRKLPVKNDSLTFTDGAQIASYAKTPVAMMQRAGIINGMKNTGSATYRFEPEGNATREQACKMLCILYELVEETPDPEPDPEPEPEPDPEEPEFPEEVVD